MCPMADTVIRVLLSAMLYKSNSLVNDFCRIFNKEKDKETVVHLLGSILALYLRRKRCLGWYYFE